METALRDLAKEEIIKLLNSTNIPSRVTALQAILRQPIIDGDIELKLVELLKDTTPAVVAMPYQYGEVRYLAAIVLRQHYGYKQEIWNGIIIPLYTDDLCEIADKQQLGYRGGVDGMLQTFSVLQKRGKLPTYKVREVK